MSETEADVLNMGIIDGILELDDGDCELLLELVTSFFSDFNSDFNILQKSINDSNFDLIDKTAHKLKGAAANLGMKMFADSAYAIEKKGKEKDLEHLDHLMENLNEAYNISVAHYKQFFNEKGETLEL